MDVDDDREDASFSSEEDFLEDDEDEEAYDGLDVPESMHTRFATVGQQRRQT